MTNTPTAVGPYRIECLLAVTASSRVFRALGPRGNVALKVGKSRRAAASIRREAELLKRCRHPHLVRVDDADPDGAWVATELLEGPDLVTWAKGRPIEQVVGAALELLESLRHLHALGVYHGDLKPAHVTMVDWGHPKLLDLGGTSSGYRATDQRGTPGFAAPEQLAGGELDAASDLYGLGATLYAALAGRAPFHDADPGVLAHLAATSSPLPPSAFRADVPSRLDRLVMSLLARHPLRRPTMPEVIKTLTRVHRSLPSSPVVGMVGAREELRRQVARAADGEAVVVVLYGPSGSGRRTLADEAARQARTEGMRLMLRSDARSVLNAATEGARPVTAMRSAAKNTRPLAKRLARLDRPSLLLVIAPRPVPALAELGAVHVAPEPLDLDAALRVGAWLGIDDEVTSLTWASVGGHPRSLWQALRADAVQHVDDPHTFELPASTRRVLEVLQARHGTVSAERVASQLRIDPETALDHLLVLEAGGMAERATDQVRFRAVELG